jgi:hypothetical protein
VVAAGTAERRAGAPSLIERATALELEADRHPREVAAEAEALVAEADRAREFVAAATAARALGVARRDGGDFAGAAEAFAAALRAARRAGDAGLAGRVRISLTGLHIVAGDLAAARAEAARAAPLLAAVDRARLEMQMAVAEERAGLLSEAVARYDAAAPVLAAAGDELWSARLRLNRSVALAQLGYSPESQGAGFVTYKPSFQAGLLAGKISMLIEESSAVIVGPKLYVEKLLARLGNA